MVYILNFIFRFLQIFLHEHQEKEGLNILELALKRSDLIKQLAAAFVPYRTPPQSFLKMYQFLIESYLKRCDKKILFVLLSKVSIIKSNLLFKSSVSPLVICFYIPTYSLI